MSLDSLTFVFFFLLVQKKVKVKCLIWWTRLIKLTVAPSSLALYFGSKRKKCIEHSTLLQHDGWRPCAAAFFNINTHTKSVKKSLHTYLLSPFFRLLLFAIFSSSPGVFSRSVQCLIAGPPTHFLFSFHGSMPDLYGWHVQKNKTDGLRRLKRKKKL